MLIDEVEALWAPIAAVDDWSPLATKLHAIGEMAQAYGTIPTLPLDHPRLQPEIG